MLKKLILFLSVMSLLILLSSCGTSRASVKVRNNAENTDTRINVTTGNGGTTTVTVSPKMSLDSLSFKFE